MADDSSYLLLNAERVEEYHSGGLHPVHLGDTLNERYTIVRKLGHGAFSTVWLAWDRSAATFAAIKICRSNSQSIDRELRMHEVLLKSSLKLPIKDHVVTMLDSFQHTGPNGEHTCLVFEPMGPDVTSLFKGNSCSSHYMPYDTACLVVKQLLLGLHCLHQHRIAYCDMNFGNLLTIVDTKQLRKQIMPPESRKDMATDENRTANRPGTLYEDRPLAEFADQSVEVKIKLADLGAAFPFDEPPEDPVIPVALRAPEVIFKSAFDHQIDIWSFGCLAFEILTGDNLFSVFPLPIDTDDQIEDEHLLHIASTFGPIPSSLFAQWTRGSRYFNEDMELVRSDVRDDSENSQHKPYVGPTLEEKFMRRRPKEMTPRETTQVLSFLRRCLQYEPSARPTTDQLLSDPWFQSIDDF